MLDQLKEQVWKLHQELPRNGLVVWTGGNVSTRDPESGLVVVEHIGESLAVLLKNHGVFTIGPTARAAVKAAVMVEDVARLHHRYLHVYGQR